MSLREGYRTIKTELQAPEICTDLNIINAAIQQAIPLVPEALARDLERAAHLLEKIRRTNGILREELAKRITASQSQ